MVLFLKTHLKIIKDKFLSENLQLRFLEQLSGFLENGYSLLDALERIKWDKEMVSTANTIIDLLKNGVTVDQALDQAKFHYTITAYLYFVRKSGDLEGSVRKCIQMFKKRMKYKQKFQQVIRYPLILLLIFSTLLFFIRQVILPSFLNIFQTNHDASLAIKASLTVINYLVPIISILVFFIITMVVWWQIYKRKSSIKSQIKILHYVPVYRKYISLQTSFQFATHLSALLKTGMPLKDILYYMSKQDKLPIVSYYSRLMSMTLRKGLPITNLLPDLYFIEQQITEIFQKNSSKNTLEKDLTAYASMLSTEIHRRMMKALTFIQPIFFIVLAFFIIFTYLILMWPMFQMINQL